MTSGGSNLARPYIFRDPVHGDIAFARNEAGNMHSLIREIVDNETFQRLRGIRQNGVLNLVFHGAEHSRFAHSLGVAHVAGQMYDAACLNSSMAPRADERALIVVAALVHDIGHGPFSHLIEEVLGKKHFHHETMTARLLVEEDSPLSAVLRKHDRDLPEKLLPFVDYKKRTENLWYHAIVSSQLDADRLDYTARDALMAGIVSHRFDRRRLIGALYVWTRETAPTGGKIQELVVDDRALDVIENYLFSLHHLYRSVYFHHTARAVSWMLNAVLRRARHLANDEKMRSELFAPIGAERDPLWALIEDGNKVPLSEYIRLDESHVWGLIQRWRRASDTTLSDLCNRLKQRRYLKAMDLPSDYELVSKLVESAKERTREINPELDVDSYVHIDQIDRQTYKPYRWTKERSGDTGEKPILIVSKTGDVRPIEQDAETTLDLLDARFNAKRLLVLPEVRHHLQEITAKR
ncbi:MAG: HD domain-containing protein [Polyangiaceae bacterium]|nr:HD domain-containing protein [Polyangiaceae bacterium]